MLARRDIVSARGQREFTHSYIIEAGTRMIVSGGEDILGIYLVVHTRAAVQKVSRCYYRGIERCDVELGVQNGRVYQRIVFDLPAKHIEEYRSASSKHGPA